MLDRYPSETLKLTQAQRLREEGRADFNARKRAEAAAEHAALEERNSILAVRELDRTAGDPVAVDA
jgi:hypothetical protein